MMNRLIAGLFAGLFLLAPVSFADTARYYFTQTLATGADPSGVAYHASWGYTSEASQYRMSTTKGSSALALGVEIGAYTAGQKALDRRYISDDLTVGTQFSTSDTFKMQILGQESAATDNVNLSIISIRVINEDGTVQAVLKAPGNYFANAEFLNASLRNVRFSDGTGGVDGNNTLATNYTTVSNDRLVIEVGTSGSGAQTTPEFQFQWGENGTDLAENETATSGNGWFEITYSTGGGPASPAASGFRMLRGFGK